MENTIAVRKDKVIYREDDKIIKLFNQNYSTANVLNEALNQARVEETGLNIPKIREVTKIDGKWAIIMDYIGGVTIETLIAEHPEKTREYLELFINAQCEVHSKKHLLLTKFTDKMKMKIMLSELDASTRYDLVFRFNEMPPETALCHGDFNPSNVVIGEDGKIFILDWSHASQGSPAADAVKTYIIFKLAKKDDLACEYMDLYCEKTGLDAKTVNEWLPLVAAAQLIKSKNENKPLLTAFINGEEKYGR